MNTIATYQTILERERLRRGLTQKELGKVLGVSEQAAGRYCLGLRTPKRGKAGVDGPAERLKAWSGGRITVLNFDKVAPPLKRQRQLAGGV